jgi:hypothetical protein
VLGAEALEFAGHQALQALAIKRRWRGTVR